MKVKDYEGLIVVTCNACDDGSGDPEKNFGSAPEHAQKMVKGWPAMTRWLSAHGAEWHGGADGGDFQLEHVETSNFADGENWLYIDVDPPGLGFNLEGG